MQTKAVSILDAKILWPAIGDAFIKLNPRMMVKNPVMFVTMVGAVISTVDAFRSPGQTLFVAQIALWLWFTVLFANFAEAVAEGRGKAQAKALRQTRTRTNANKLNARDSIESVDADSLSPGHSTCRHSCASGLAERLRLCLAAAFGDGFGKVREQHGEPEPAGQF